ncbi:MAG TPA: FHA domain-containing protein, partial [Thermoplasmata archaeon]|nr:FHA domain-containing protein [Thermoplasmata archaeon]
MTKDSQTLLIRVPGKEPELVRIEGDGPFPLGRLAECKIVVNDAAVSRQHAQVWREDGAYWIKDLGSKNGTKVNGNLISAPSRLNQGDRIDIGPCSLEFGESNAPGTSARVADTKAPGSVHAVPLAEIVGGASPAESVKAMGS